MSSSMSSARSRQQRLFTGALLPEVLNAQLLAFATRHYLQSNVWVPQKAFGVALKPYNIFILPNAALCDVSLTPGGGVADISEAIGTDRVLVNAQHTSNQKLLEEFRDFLVTRLAAPVPPTLATMSSFFPKTLASGVAVQGAVDRLSYENPSLMEFGNRLINPHPKKAFFSAEDRLRAKTASAPTNSCVDFTRVGAQQQPLPIVQPDPLWNSLPPFQHPLALNGSLFLGTEVSMQLLQWQKQGHCFSNYWRRLCSPSTKQQRFVHVESTEFPGRYNPFFCVRYVPHNYTGWNFPMDIARLMRHRAVEYGYVSRLWLTQRQGEELFGTTLLPERAHDLPTVYCNHHSGGLESIAYHCADQFANSEDVFPTLREIELVAKGVWAPSTKIAAFPLLRRLQKKYGTGTTPSSSDRGGMDLAMRDANRHTEFCQLTEAYSTIRLVDFAEERNAAYYLKASRLRKTLQRQCILCGYPTPVFISHRTLAKLDLALKEGEEGVVQVRLPVKLPQINAWTNGECWFNVAQMLESAIGAELLEHWPRQFLTRRRLNGYLVPQCCRIQISERARATNTTELVTAAAAEWVPYYIIKLASWKLRQDAPGVRYSPYSAEAEFKLFFAGGNILFRMEDVCLDVHIKEWMRRYTPVDESGYPFLRGLRQLLTLRAYERAYQSKTWVSFSVERGKTHPLPLRPTAHPVRQGIAPLDTHNHAFAQPPSVRFRNFLFVNTGELLPEYWQRMRRLKDGSGAATDTAEDASAEPDAPLQRMDAYTSAMVANGIGISAEAFVTQRAQARAQGLYGALSFHPSDHSTSGDDDDDGQAAMDDFGDDDFGDLPYDGAET